MAEYPQDAGRLPSEPGLWPSGHPVGQSRSDSSVARDSSGVQPLTLPDPAISTPPPDHELTVVIPAYNEAVRLPQTLDSLSQYLAAWGIDHRVVVVDDGSQDATASLIDGRGHRFSVIRQPNQGKGAAVRNGMLHATGRVVAFTDADLPYHLRSLRLGYDRIHSGEVDVAFGARDLAESSDVAKRPLARRAAHTAFRTAVRLLLGTQITDTQCGLKLFSRNAAIEIFRRGIINGFAFDAEVVYLTQVLGLSHCRLPVTLLNDAESSISLSRHALPMLWDVIGLRLRAMRGGYHLSRALSGETGCAGTAEIAPGETNDDLRPAA